MPRGATIDRNFDAGDDAAADVRRRAADRDGTSSVSVAPLAGDVIVDVGGTVSVDAVAGARPG